MRILKTLQEANNNMSTKMILIENIKLKVIKKILNYNKYNFIFFLFIEMIFILIF